jgi:ABC-type nitrate/sulfonate/bicarbonate transport system permease component
MLAPDAGCRHDTIPVGEVPDRPQVRDRLRVGHAQFSSRSSVLGVIWEMLAWREIFPRRLFPTIEEVAASFVRLTVAGNSAASCSRHGNPAAERLCAGCAYRRDHTAVLMGRSRRARISACPLVSICAPIPWLAYAPLFLLWFGLGNFSAVLLVGFVSAFPILFNSWTGVKAVKEIWVRSAQSMGADDRRLFSHVILPGALPYILTGLRLGLAQAWRILVAVEMLAAVPWGLGWLIFGAREFPQY